MTQKRPRPSARRWANEKIMQNRWKTKIERCDDALNEPTKSIITISSAPKTGYENG